MKLNRKSLVAVAGVLVVGLIAWLILGSGHDEGDNGGGSPVPVVAGLVSSGDVPLYFSGIGTVQAYNTVTVHARVDGELVNVAFKEGQDVKKGDLLVQIDPKPFQAALDNALGNLARDQATLANAKRDLARYQQTAAKGYSSRQQLDTQESTVASLTASVQADAATVENARVQLGYTDITAPLDGRTGIRLVDQGNIVHAADPGGLVVITQLDPIAVIFTLPQDKLPAVNAALAQGPLAVIVDSRDNETELGRGTLELVDNQIDPATGTIRLKARFPNPAHKLWPGEFVNARLQVGNVPSGLTVPTEVVQRGAQGPYAYVIKPDNTIEVRQVEVGPEDRGRILITKGLQAGDRVVVDGQLRLQPGALVQIVDRNGNPVQTGALGAPQAAGGQGAPDGRGATIR
ncbi:MAG TPA: efflux RND transporter periplasmic adaptor subunit [Alphaproteobacteria bacterium]|nr:efflux RND transporter periplasmic adaptor subunit [Alphaproteobacteria bacterium]